MSLTSLSTMAWIFFGGLTSVSRLVQHWISWRWRGTAAAYRSNRLSLIVTNCCIDTCCRALSIDSNCLQAKQFLILHLLCKEGNYTEVHTWHWVYLLTFAFVLFLYYSFLSIYTRYVCNRVILGLLAILDMVIKITVAVILPIGCIRSNSNGTVELCVW